jgi:Domain of unknown function (DUF4234)
MVAVRPIGETRSISLSIVLAIVTFWIYTFYWTYVTHDELERYSKKGLGGAVGLVIYVLCFLVGYFPIAITCIFVSSEVQRLYEEDGRQAPHSAAWGLWFLLPVVGPFVWFIPTQQALNDFWASKGAPPPGEESTLTPPTAAA